LPREYFQLPAPRAMPAAPKRLQGVPTFYVLQYEPIRPGALLSGGVLSLVVLTTCWMSLNSVISPYHAAASQPQNAWSSSDSARSSASPSNSDDSASSSGRYATKFAPFDPAKRKRILAAAVANLKNHYYDRDAAQKMSDALVAHESRGD